MRLATRVLLGGSLTAAVLLPDTAGAQFHSAMFNCSTTQPGFALPAPHIDINLGYAF